MSKDIKNFIKEHGLSLNEINPGSNEYALKTNDAIKAVELLQGSRIAILGGDILSIVSGKLNYVYQNWGGEYHYLNWHCDKLSHETQDEYANKSYKIALDSISRANKIAEQLNVNCFIVLVLQEDFMKIHLSSVR